MTYHSERQMRPMNRYRSPKPTFFSDLYEMPGTLIQ